MPRRFTPSEANEELREIRPLVEELVAHRREQQRLQAERRALAHRIAGNGGGIHSNALAELEEAERRERVEVVRCVNAVHERGAIVKDPDTGLVDFPARLEGQEVLLCWRLGEEQVAHWHGLEEGFAGRKLLDPE
ncbi:MAG: DUF2203 domain-containing protein [Gaiellaceae bacterium]|jgi:hypothetical protein